MNNLPKFATDEELDKYLVRMGYCDDSEVDITIMDGYPQAVKGIVWDEQLNTYRLVYDVPTILEILTDGKEEGDKDMYIEALEFFQYNILRGISYLNEVGPLLDYGPRDMKTPPTYQTANKKPAKRKRKAKK